MESSPVIAKWRVEQSVVCEQHGVELDLVDLGRNSGESANLIGEAWFEAGTCPLRGERYLATPTTTGWYVWAGENDGTADFVRPVHTIHLETWCADAVPYLGLPSGWSFYLAPGVVDVWFEAALLVK